MKFLSVAVTSLLATRAVAFGVQPTAFARSGIARHISTALKANVLKLTEPDKFLDGIDVFIFDCDGVIWRVRALKLCLLYVELLNHSIKNKEPK